jgi:hypothetical protein
VFWSRYPQTKLTHTRILCSHGRERGASIIPKPFAVPPPEIVHRHSCIVPLNAPGKIMAIEWTGELDDRHLADL